MTIPSHSRTTLRLTGGPRVGRGGWTVRAVGDVSRVPDAVRGRTVAASVPGCVHTDLMDAGLIADPAVGMNEAECQWVSWTDWRYELVFDADAGLIGHERVDLVFKSLDTIARVELNGVHVGDAANEFLPYRFDVRAALKSGENRLSVVFKSPLRHVREEETRLGARPVNGDWEPFVFMRKCASNFRWDWGPRVATCGIVAGVTIEGWSGARLFDVSVGVMEVSERRAVVRVGGRIEGGIGTPRVEIRASGQEITLAQRVERVANGAFDLELEILGDLHLWSPAVHPQLGYQVEALVLGEQSSHEVIDRVSRRVGLRTCAWDNGCVIVNGRREFCRGVNWIPEGLWPRDRTRERVEERLSDIACAGMNMVRVWGGGRYEPDWFYDLCDEMGIMVWQDFMFSCACYPEEEPIRSLVEAEARHQVRRLRHHPSIVLWCGGNECVWAYESWGFKDKLTEGRSWGAGYYFDLLPRVCAELDASRPYLPNSPWSGTGVHPNDAGFGDRHTWDVWGDGYREIVPRLCSEFGQQSPSNLATLREAGLVPDAVSESAGASKVMGSGSLVPAALLARQLGPGGMERWYDGPLAKMFRAPRSFEEWHYLAQLLQARSMATGIEWMRANWPACMGALVWQMNDAWPGFSWSLIDSAGREKPAYKAVSRENWALWLTLQPLDGVLSVVAVNDSDRPVDEGRRCEFEVRRVGFDGRVLSSSGRSGLVVEERSVARVCSVEEAVGAAEDPRRELVVVDCDGERATWYWRDDGELVYPQPRIEARARPHGVGVEQRGFTMNITAQTLVRDLWFQPELRMPGALVYGPMLGTMLPGETRSLSVILREPANVEKILVELESEALRSPPVMWCANHFGFA